MFDFSKLGDMAKMANQAKQMQQRQDKFQGQMLEVLKKISSQLDEVLTLLKSRA